MLKASIRIISVHSMQQLACHKPVAMLDCSTLAKDHFCKIREVTMASASGRSMSLIK